MSDDERLPLTRALTAWEVWHELGLLFDRLPECRDWPVHILDMLPDEPDNEDKIDVEAAHLDGLVTLVETDVMTDEQGQVVALLSWPQLPRFIARHAPGAAAVGVETRNERPDV